MENFSQRGGIIAELNEVLIRQHDQIGGLGRVALFPSSAKRIIEVASATITYVGVAAPGSATSLVKGWFIEKIDTSVANTTTITHATDAWDNRVTATYS